MDFNFKTYQSLLAALQSRGFSFLTVSEYAEELNSDLETPSLAPRHSSPVPQHTSLVPRPSSLNIRPSSPFVLLRHDVEARYENALQMARIQHSRGIKGTYYFRIYDNNGHGEVIREIAALGHEIGYHYDDLSHCKGDYDKAIKRFEKNLTYLRQFGTVTSATMEGAPLSRFDNRDLWKNRKSCEGENGRMGEGEKGRVGEGEKGRMGEGEKGRVERNGEPIPSLPHPLTPSPLRSLTPSLPVPIYHYRDFGIQTEPYFDFDFNQLYYLTDTGRRWDGHLYNVRDKATKENPITNPDFLNRRYHSTNDIITAINEGSFPQQVMLNFHPQRWNDNWLAWTKELVWQNVKNQGKRFLVKK